MNNTTKRVFLILLSVLTMLCLCGCSKHKNSGDETTVALDTVFEAVADGDASVYRTAFPPDYVALLESELAVIDEELNKKLLEDMAVTKESREMNFGDDTYSYYTLTTKEPLEIKDLNEGYNDYYLPHYKLTLSSVTEAYCVNVMVTVGGDDDESTNGASFVVIKLDGKWYLHPKYFFYMI